MTFPEGRWFELDLEGQRRAQISVEEWMMWPSGGQQGTRGRAAGECRGAGGLSQASLGYFLHRDAPERWVVSQRIRYRWRSGTQSDPGTPTLSSPWFLPRSASSAPPSHLVYTWLVTPKVLTTVIFLAWKCVVHVPTVIHLLLAMDINFLLGTHCLSPTVIPKAWMESPWLLGGAQDLSLSQLLPHHKFTQPTQ